MVGYSKRNLKNDIVKERFCEITCRDEEERIFLLIVPQGSETSGRNRFLPGRMEETGKNGRKRRKLEEIHV